LKGEVVGPRAAWVRLATSTAPRSSSLPAIPGGTFKGRLDIAVGFE
jgi:hypothetical protein